ncbi:hypothetical protein BH24ACT8_BH24ACT8_19780 [soil metagenome]
MTRQMLAGVPIGARVVVRHLIEDGDRATDTLGPLLERTGTHLVVATRAGQVRVAVEDVVAAKAVPPAPARRRSAPGT